MSIEYFEIIEFLENRDIEYTQKGEKIAYIDGFSSLNNYRKNTITWIKKKENYDGRRIDFCITEELIQGDIKCQIKVANSKKVFFDIIEELMTKKEEKEAVGVGTYIGKNVQIGEGTTIGANCSITGNVKIGRDVSIGDNVVIKNNVEIGNNTEIQSLAVIGEDGFAYSEDNKKKKMIKHYGGVNIGENVHIGSCTCIVRGTIDDTTIGNESKIDNLCHIAHNVQIGENVALIAGSLIYGSVKIDDNSYIASGIVRNQVNIGKEAFVGMGSVVTKDIEDKKVAVGIPAKIINNK